MQTIIVQAKGTAANLVTDKISVTENVTISGGLENDSINVANDVKGNTKGAHVFTYTPGDGNDTIYGYNSNDTIAIIGSDKVTGALDQYGNFQITVTDSTGGNKGTITIQNTSTNADEATKLTGLAGIKLNVVTLANSDTTLTSATAIDLEGLTTDKRITKTIKGTTGNDSYNITNSGFIVNANDGKDTISVTGSATTSGSSISGGNDADIIYITADSSGRGTNTQHVSIQYAWDAEADTYMPSATDTALFLKADKAVTVYGGAGNDIIYAESDTLAAHVYHQREDTLTAYYFGESFSTANLGNYVSQVGSEASDTVSVAFSTLLDSLAVQTRKYTDDGEGNITTSTVTAYKLDQNSTVKGIIQNRITAATAESDTFKGLALTDTVRASSGTYTNETDTTFATIHGAHVYEFGANDGNDTIYGFNENDTIFIKDDSTLKGDFDSTGEHYVITVGGSGQIWLMNYGGGQKLHVRNSSGVMNVSGESNSTDDDNGVAGYITIKQVLRGSTGADELTITADNFTVNADTGDDLIVGQGASSISLFGGAGNDTISLEAATVATTAEDGTPATVSVYGSAVTVYGGAGNDSIVGEWQYDDDGTTKIPAASARPRVYQFGYNDGNDTIMYYNSNDTISLESGSVVKSVEIGGDNSENLIVNVGQRNSTNVTATIVLANYVDADRSGNIQVYEETVSADGNTTGYDIRVIDIPREINGTNGNDSIYNAEDNYTISGMAMHDTINNIGSNIYIDGGAGNDTIISRGSNNEILGGEGSGADVVILRAEDPDAKAYIFVNEDGTSTTTVPSAGYYYSTWDETNKKYQALVNSTRIASTDELSEANKTLVAAQAAHDEELTEKLQSAAMSNEVSVGGGNDTIVASGSGGNVFKFGESDGTNYILNYTSGDAIQIDKTVDLSTTNTQAAWTQEGYTVTIGSTKIILKGNINSSINSAVDANIVKPENYYNLQGGTTVTIQKYDTNAIKWTESYVPVPLEVTGTNGNDVIINTTLQTGYTDVNSYKISAEGGNDSVYSEGDYVTINAGAGQDTVSLGSAATGNSIYGGTGNDVIFANGKSNIYKYVPGTDGNDTIFGYGSNDTIQLEENTTLTDLLAAVTGADASVKSIEAQTEITDDGFVIKFGNNTILLRGELLTPASTVIDTEWGKLSDTEKDKYFATGSNHTSTDEDAIAAAKANFTTAYMATDTYRKNGDNYGFLAADTTVKFQVVTTNATSGAISAGTISIQTVTVPREIKYTNDDDTITIADTYEGYKVNAYNGNDVITNNANKVSINAGGGDDLIKLQDGSAVTVLTGTGNDTIEVTNNNANLYTATLDKGTKTILGLNSNDTIQVAGASLKSAAFDNAEYYVLTFVDSSGGNETKIKLKGKYDTTNSAWAKLTGKDTYYLKVDTATDTAAVLKNVPNVEYVTVTAETTFDSQKSNHDIIGDAQANQIVINGANKVSIDAGKGNDTINVSKGDDITIAGGAGNDSINLATTGHVVEYALGEGQDSIKGWNEKDTLYVTGVAADVSIVTSVMAAGFLVQFGNTSSKILFEGVQNSDKIQIKGLANTNTVSGDAVGNGTYDASGILTIGIPKLIKGTNSNDEIANIPTYNDGNNDDFVIRANAGNDSITNTGNSVTIDGGSGNDTIINDYEGTKGGANVSIKGGAGNDVIYTSGKNGEIFGNNGTDIVSLSADAISNTIEGGAGNDTIYANDLANTIVYNKGDGDDVILNFDAGSTVLELKGGVGVSVTGTGANAEAVTEVTSDGFVIYLDDGSKLTLKGTKNAEKGVNDNKPSDFDGLIGGTTFNIKVWDAAGSSSVDTPIRVSDKKVVIDGEALKNYDANHTIIGTSNVDTIVNSGDAVIVNARGSNDLIINSGDNVSISAGDGNDVIVLNNRYNNETGARTELSDYTKKFYDAKKQDMVNPEADHVTVYAGKGDDTIYGNTNGNDDATKAHTYQYNDGDGNDVIYNFGANDIIDLGTFDMSKFANGAADALPYTISYINLKKEDGSDDADYKDVRISVGEKAGTILLKRMAVDTTIHINYSASTAPTTVINKIESVQRYHVLSGTEGNTSSNTFTNDTKGYTIYSDILRSDYVDNTAEDVTINLVYSDNTVHNSGDKTNITTGDGNDVITNSGANSNINAGTGNNSITNEANGAETTILTGDGSDTIVNQASGAVINSGEGHDLIDNQSTGDGSTVNAGEGNDTIYNAANYASINAGDDDDIIYSAQAQGGSSIANEEASIVGGKGNDTIFGATEGRRIYIYNSGDGNDVISQWSDNDELHFELGVSETYVQEYTSEGVVFTINQIVEKEGANNTVSTSVSVTGSILITSLTSATATDSDNNTVTTYTRHELGGGKQINITGRHITGYDDVNDSIEYGDIGDDYVTPLQKFVNATIENTDADYTLTPDGNSTSRTIINKGEAVTINAGAGADTIFNSAENASIFGGDGADQIYVGTATNSVTGTAPDQVTVKVVDELQDVAGITVRAGADNDTITALANHSEAIVYEYHEGDGNDTIVGFNQNDIIKIYLDDFSTYDAKINDTVDTANNNFKLNIGSGSIYLKGYTQGTVQVLNANNPDAEIVEIEIPQVTYIKDSANATSNTAGGYDYTNNVEKSIVYGSSSDDKITNATRNAQIYGEAGNDSIVLGDHEKVTVIPGAGSDTITAQLGHTKGVVYELTASDGNNLIENFNAYDTISYSGALVKDLDSVVSQQTDGNGAVIAGALDLILTFGNGTNVTLKNYGIPNAKVTLKDTDQYSETAKVLTVATVYAGDSVNNTMVAYADSLEVQGYAGNDILTNNEYDHVSIYGGAGLDKIINKGDNALIHGDNDKVTVTNANDTVDNEGNNVTIYGGSGIDSIVNKGENVSIFGGSQTDYITNSGKAVYIDGGADNDIITNNGEQVTITGGIGVDRVTNSGKNASISFGAEIAGQNTIINTIGADNSKIIGGKDINLISNYASDVTVVAYAGADRVTNAGSGADIDVGDGNNIITNTNTGSNSKIKTGSGIDNISNAASTVTIDAGAGNDIINIQANATNISVDAGAGNDIINIQANATNISVDAGEGNDNITVALNAQAIIYTGNADSSAGTKLDLITNNSSIGNVYQFDPADGAINTRIVNYKATDKIQLLNEGVTSANINSYIKALDVNSFDPTYQYLILNFLDGEGNDAGQASLHATAIRTEGKLTVLDKSGQEVTLAYPKLVLGSTGHDTKLEIHSSITGTDRNGYTFLGLAGNDTIVNDGENATIDGGVGNDSIMNSGANTSIFADQGNDFITNSANNVIIDGGLHNDSITNSGNNVSIAGGQGIDTIVNNGAQNVTVWGGLHNDQFVSDGQGSITYQFGAGEGLNTIRGFNTTNDKLFFTSISDSAVVSAATINGAGNKISLSAGTVTVTAFADSDTTGGGHYFDKAANAIKYQYNYTDENDAEQTGNGTVNVAVRVLELREEYDNTNAEYTEAGRIFGKNTNTITNTKDKIEVYATIGAATITNTGNSDTVLTGAGIDKISVGGSGSSINAGASNDIISIGSSATGNTIYGGYGNDSIESNGNGNTFYYSGNLAEGADTIKGFDLTKDTLFIGMTTAPVITSSVNDAGNAIVTITSGRITTTITLEDKAEGGSVKLWLGTKDEQGNLAPTAYHHTIGTTTGELGAGHTPTTTTTAGRVAEDPVSAINDLFDDDNYLSNDSSISDITNVTENNYSAGNIETLNFESLAKSTYVPVAAYTKKK